MFSQLTHGNLTRERIGWDANKLKNRCFRKIDNKLEPVEKYWAFQTDFCTEFVYFTHTSPHLHPIPHPISHLVLHLPPPDPLRPKTPNTTRDCDPRPTSSDSPFGYTLQNPTSYRSHKAGVYNPSSLQGKDFDVNWYDEGDQAIHHTQVTHRLPSVFLCSHFSILL